MRIVKISDLSEEERKKILEKQRERQERIRLENEDNNKQIKEQFNSMTQNNTAIAPTASYKSETSKVNLPVFSNEPIKNVDTKYIGKAVKAGEGINSNNVGERISANIRYALDKAKNAITESPKSIASWIIGSVAADNQKYAGQGSLGDKLGKILYGKETAQANQEKLESTQEKFKKYLKKNNANNNSESLYKQTLPEATKTFGTVGENVGRMLPTIGASAINPTLGNILLFGSTSGQEMSNLVDEGIDFKTARTVGNLKGAVEVGTEKLTGGIKFRGKGALDDIVGNTIANKTTNKVTNFLLTKGYQGVGEIGEEYISNIAGYAIDKLFLNKNTSLKEIWEDTKETTKTTFLTTLTLNLMGLGGSNFSESKNVTTNQELVKEYENVVGKKLNLAEKNQLFKNVENIKEEIKSLTSKSTQNEFNNQGQQTILKEQQTSQNQDINQLNNNVANNQKSLYNNNESESDINGYSENEQKRQSFTNEQQRQNMGRDISESRIFEKSKQEQQAKQYSESKYREWEQSIISKKENELSKEEKQLKSDIGKEENKEVVFIKSDNKQGYNAGASLNNSNKIYINPVEAKIYGLRRTALHESMESNIRFSDESSKDIITSTIQDIINDKSFQIQKEEFWKDQNENIPNDTAIAKDIICDIYAREKGEKLDYEILLSDELKNRINMSIEYFKKNSNKSSFSLPIRRTSQNRSTSSKNFSTSLTNSNNNISPINKDVNVKTKDTSNIIAPIVNKQISDKDLEILNKIYEKEGKTEIKTREEIEKENKTAELLEKLTNDKMTLNQQKDFLIQKLVNKGHAVDKLAKTTGNKNLTFKYDRILGAQSEGQYEVGVAQTDNSGNKIGKSINDIWKPIEDNKMVKEFSEYLLHKHNIDRVAQGKPIFGEDIDSSTSKSMLSNFEKLYPEFKEYSKDINTYYKNQMQNMVDAGLTSEETQQLLNDMYDNYIIVSRNKESSYKEPKYKVTGTRNPIKKTQGGNADIQPLKDAMAKQTIAVKQAIRQNELGLELLKTMKNAQDASEYDINNVVSKDNKGAYFIIFENGKAKRLNITEDLYDSLKPTQRYKIEETLPLKAVQKVSNIQRSLLTVDNPVFMITNFFKDFQDGLFNSKYTTQFLKNYGVALNEIKNKGKYYQEYIANGGNSNTYFEYDKGVKKENKIGKFINKIKTGNEIIEMAPRLAEYISTRKDGKNIDEAMYNAAEITTNFKRGGEITKVLNRNGVNFLNASVQGLSKQIRNLTGQNGVKGYTNLLIKATTLGVVPAVLNQLLLGDDDDYEDLPDYVKDTYYLFKIDDNKFLRIPKGRPLSIFGSVARRTLDYANGDKEAFNGLASTVNNQMAPNNPLNDNIIAPIKQAVKNETWYGGQLVPTRLQSELPENQYDESTDKFSKWLGKLTGISPMKINYVIDQYSGGAGDILLPAITPQAENNVLTDKFTINSVLKNKNVSKFYDTLEEQTKVSNAPEATEKDILKAKYLNSVQSSVSDLYKEKREIQLSDLKDEEKKKEVIKIQKDINNTLEKGLKEYDSGDIKNNYATIGDEQYYKDKDNEWTKLTKEEKEKNKNISLKTYADYKDKTYKRKEELVKSGEIKEKGTLSDKEKISILSSSNYSEKEKIAIYENYILNSNDKTYKILKQTGISTNEYLKYKQQEFESDKKDDGTADGKTVIGSAKKKAYSYVNNMDITYNQKLMLLGLNYSLNNVEKTKLAKYVNNMNIGKQDKLDIFSKLSGFTVYKNGRVTW